MSATELGTRILAGALGAFLVFSALRSAIRTLILPRPARDWLVRLIFRGVRFVFRLPLSKMDDYERRDSWLAMYAPVGIVVLLASWIVCVGIGFMGLYIAVGVGSLGSAFRLSGSSLLTLGSAGMAGPAVAALAFAEAFVGLLLIALVIAYLPTMYSGFARREETVNLLAVRAGTPPSAVDFLLRAERIGLTVELGDLWSSWERWFAAIEESHTSLAPLVFFRSPHPQHSWITAAGAILDAAALTDSCLDVPRDYRTQLCLRAGYLALRNIGAYFRVDQSLDPRFPRDQISVTRAEFDEAMARLESGGVPLRRDRDTMWQNFGGWRVNYDAALIALCALTEAPTAPWSSDRALRGALGAIAELPGATDD